LHRPRPFTEFFQVVKNGDVSYETNRSLKKSDHSTPYFSHWVINLQLLTIQQFNLNYIVYTLHEISWIQQRT